MLVKGEKWWRLPDCPSHFSIEVREDIHIRPFIAAARSHGLAARYLTNYLEDYFTREQLRYGVG
jgi:hypothetical protein